MHGVQSHFYNDLTILAHCQSLTIIDIRPSALKFHMAHGMACRPRALQLGRNMTAHCSTFNHLSQKIAGRRAVASSRTRIVPTSLISRQLPQDVSNLCHRSGRGFEARLLPSSQQILPRRRACQAHAPLFEWTKLLSFQTRSPVSLSSTSPSSSPSSSSSVFFSRRTRCR